MPHYRSLMAIAAAGAVVLGGLAGGASAAGACTSDNAFCVTYNLSATTPGAGTAETHAAAPANLDVSLANTSTDHASNTNHWLDHVVLTLYSGLGGKAYTASNLLDNNLLIAGSSTDCSAADFSDCTAGHGTFYASISGTGGLFDGIYPGAFGIQRITNVNPVTVAGADLQWSIVMTFCVHGTPVSVPCQSDVFTAAGSSVSNGTVTLPARPTQPFTYGSASIDASLDSGTVHLNAGSALLGNGDAAPSGQQTVLHLPLRCGTATADATLVDRAADTVAVPLSLAVTGCPTARFTTAENYLRVTFNGSGSTTPISGRTIKRWHWTFGDGTSRVTTGATAARSYAYSRDRTVRLVVEDSLGALSTTRSFLLKGSAMTWVASASRVKPGTAVTLSGRLTRWHTTTGLGGRSVRIQRCNVGTSRCSLVRTVTTSRLAGRRGRFSVVIHPTTAGDYRATFFGGGGYLGIRRVHRITMR